jgi:hypothetical protein
MFARCSKRTSHTYGTGNFSMLDAVTELQTSQGFSQIKVNRYWFVNIIQNWLIEKIVWRKVSDGLDEVDIFCYELQFCLLARLASFEKKNHICTFFARLARPAMIFCIKWFSSGRQLTQKRAKLDLLLTLAERLRLPREELQDHSRVYLTQNLSALSGYQWQLFTLFRC